jgi:hypothetical protein
MKILLHAAALLALFGILKLDGEESDPIISGRLRRSSGPDIVLAQEIIEAFVSCPPPPDR